jgi:hypothetical protein
MSNINGYPEVCDSCGQKRTCNGIGLCHECDQLEQDAADNAAQLDDCLTLDSRE